MQHALSPSLLDSLRYLAPDRLCDNNFWMNHSFQRDGASASILLQSMRGLNAALLEIEKLQEMLLVVTQAIH